MDMMQHSPPTEVCILGCGSSAGVPVVGNHWGLCNPIQPKNHRTRCGAMMRFSDQTWLIDVTPDFRYQALRENIQRIDGVLLTHAHFDHIGGLDDLKPFAIQQGGPIPIWMDAVTWDLLHLRYFYAFVGCDGAYVPFLLPRLIDGPIVLGDMTVVPFEQDHGHIKSLGFRFPKWAYSTDVISLEPAALDALKGLKVWFVDCIGRTPKSSHAHWDITMDWISHIRPEQTFLIHMGTEMDYETVCAELPDSIRPAYDGLRLSID